MLLLIEPLVSNRCYLHMWLLITTSLNVYLNLLPTSGHACNNYIVSSIFQFLLQGVVLGTYDRRSKQHTSTLNSILTVRFLFVLRYRLLSHPLDRLNDYYYQGTSSGGQRRHSNYCLEVQHIENRKPSWRGGYCIRSGFNLVIFEEGEECLRREAGEQVHCKEEYSRISHTGFCQFFSCLCTGIAIFELLYYFIGSDLYFIGSDLY